MFWLGLMLRSLLLTVVLLRIRLLLNLCLVCV